MMILLSDKRWKITSSTFNITNACNDRNQQTEVGKKLIHGEQHSKNSKGIQNIEGIGCRSHPITYWELLVCGDHSCPIILL